MEQTVLHKLLFALVKALDIIRFEGDEAKKQLTARRNRGKRATRA